MPNKTDEIIYNNLGLVRACALKFTGKGIEYDDLYQSGCVGLIKAAEAYDNERGFAFSTYAVPVILGEIKRQFRDGGAVHVSRGLKELSLKISKFIEKRIKDTGESPKLSEIAEVFSVEETTVTDALNVMVPTVSLTCDFDGETKETAVAFDESEEISNKLFVKQIISRLSEKEKELIKLRYYRNFTQSQAAEKLNMTQVGVSRMEKKIFAEIRKVNKFV